MKRGLVIFAAILALAAPAWAQSSITLTADPVPIVEAQINNRPVRLEVDLRMPDVLALSSEAGARLGVRRVPFVAAQIGIEGSDASIRGRIARPRFTIAGESSRVFAGLFPAPVTQRADGVIGPGALPHDVVTIVLGAERPGMRDIVFALEDPDVWRATADIGGHRLSISFNLADEASVFNRSAARLFDGEGSIPAAGELTQAHVILGLSTLMQPVDTQLTTQGLALRPALARTNAPLLGATEEDAIVVEARPENQAPPGLAVGRAALSDCTFLRVERRARRLTLRCA